MLWSFWAATAGLVTLVGARRVITSNDDAGMVFRPSVAFEIMLMTATVLVCGGFLVWLIQSLAGFGRIVPEVALRRRPRADRLALVLMGTLLVFVFAWDPPTVGGALHGRALAWQQDGYRVIPLALSLAARKCDPTGVDYAVTAIELNRELGRDEAAAALRADLDRQLASYLALRRKEEARARVTSAAVPRETAPPAGEAALGFGQGLSINWPRSDAFERVRTAGPPDHPLKSGAVDGHALGADIRRRCTAVGGLPPGHQAGFEAIQRVTRLPGHHPHGEAATAGPAAGDLPAEDHGALVGGFAREQRGGFPVEDIPGRIEQAVIDLDQDLVHGDVAELRSPP